MSRTKKENNTIKEGSNNTMENNNIMENNVTMDNVVQRFSDTWNYDKSENFVQYEKSDGTIGEVTKRTFEFTEKIGNRSTLTVTDEKIIDLIMQIKCAQKMESMSKYIICRNLHKLNDKETLKKLGFKTIGEYAKAVHGIESSTANHYARIGKFFINDQFKLHPALPDLSVSHLIELESYASDSEGNIDMEVIIGLYQQGTLTDSMSTKKTREVLKKLRTGGIEQNDSNTSNDNESSNESDDDNNSKNDTQVNSDSSDSSDSSHNENYDLSMDFDRQRVVGKMYSLCEDISNGFTALANNDIEVVGYKEHLDALLEMLKTLMV